MTISSGEQLQRLISIVAWVHDQGAPTIDEVCERFSISREELVAELDMASMVGSESDDYNAMPIELYYEDDRVHLYLTAFQRPLRLTPEQALALLGAGATALRLDPEAPRSPLNSAVEKIAAVLGVKPEETLDIDLGAADPALLDLLRGAVAAQTALRVKYWSAGSDKHSDRILEPWAVFNESGAWYLQAWCRDVDAVRIFRIDRIATAAPLSAPADGDPNFERPSDVPPARAFAATPDDPRVTLLLAPEAAWVATSYPVDDVVEQADGQLLVTMPAGAAAFLSRLLLRLGPNCVVISDEQGKAAASAADAAQRILARYSVQSS